MRDSTSSKPTRELILDSTERLLARFGYRKMTIDDLARDVGIGKGSVYLHFASKEEIALSHIDRIIDRLKGRLERISAKAKPADARIREMLVERVVFRFDSVQSYTQGLNEMLAQVRPRLLERRERYFEEEAQMFAKVIAGGAADGTFRNTDPLVAARTLIVATNSLLPYSLSTKELGKRSEIEKRARGVADMLLNGLCSR